MGVALCAVASGCTSGEIVLGDGLPNEAAEASAPLPPSLLPGLPLGHPPFGALPPGHPPVGQGGGPPSMCHPDPGDLGEPSEAPEGYESPDDSDISPAHPPHLRPPERGRRWEDRI